MANLAVFNDHHLELTRSFHFKTCQRVYLFMMFLMLLKVFMNVIGHLVVVMLARSLKHDIIFAIFLETLSDNIVTASCTHAR